MARYGLTLLQGPVRLFVGREDLPPDDLATRIADARRTSPAAAVVLPRLVGMVFADPASVVADGTGHWAIVRPIALRGLMMRLCQAIVAQARFVPVAIVAEADDRLFTAHLDSANPRRFAAARMSCPLVQ